jgi:hypothetical protein
MQVVRRVNAAIVVAINIGERAKGKQIPSGTATKTTGGET